MIVLSLASSGCASTVVAREGEDPADSVASTVTAPFVGTWRWSGSGGRLGDIALGEEHIVVRADGTYGVLSTSGEGVVECYEGTFTWHAEEGLADRGTIVFRSSRVPDPSTGFERDVYLEGTDTLHFGDGGTYLKTSDAVDTRCR